MRLLLDTHALVWWFNDDPMLGDNARAAIANAASEIFVSPVSACEMALKFQLGRLPNVAALLEDLSGYLDRHHFLVLPITLSHAKIAGQLPLSHRDPFDRLLIAQAQVERVALVSNEALFDRFEVDRLW